MIAYEILTMERYHVLNADVQIYANHVIFPPKFDNGNAKELIKSLLNIYPAKRPNCSEIQCFDFFKQN